MLILALLPRLSGNYIKYTTNINKTKLIKIFIGFVYNILYIIKMAMGKNAIAIVTYFYQCLFTFHALPYLET